MTLRIALLLIGSLILCVVALAISLAPRPSQTSRGEDASANYASPSRPPSPSPATASPWGANYFPNVPVVTHDGKELRFYDDLIKGKIVVVNFIYTSCTDVCSLTTARLAQVRELLGERVGRDIFFYSITLDPVTDGPEVLKKYAHNFYDGPGWLFITGKPGDIELVREKLGERSRSLNEHRNDVMLGNDNTGEWGRDSVFTDVKRLARVILDMDPKERDMVHSLPSSDNQGRLLALGNTPGQGLFRKMCAACHTVGKGKLIGPDLAGVTDRREREWLARFIAAPNRMLADKDPLALALATEFGGLRMPNLRLAETDVSDVLSYLETESRRVAAQDGNGLGSSPGSDPLESNN